MNIGELDRYKIISKNMKNKNKEILSNTYNPQNTPKIIDDSNFSILEENSYNRIVQIKPSGNFLLCNFEYNKLYSEKISIKNLMNFPIVFKVRSNDTKKIEIVNKIHKLSANGNTNIEFKLKIENIINSTNNSNLNNSTITKEKTNLFIFITSELFEIKYPIEITSKNNCTYKEENIQNLKENSQNSSNRLDMATYFPNISQDELDMFPNMPLKKLDKKIDRKIILENFKNENFCIKGKETIFNSCEDCKKNEIQILKLSEENKNLKLNLKHLMEKFKDMENLIQSYADLLSIQNQQNQSLNISRNNFIHFNENFTIFNTYGPEKYYNDNDSEYEFNCQESLNSQESLLSKRNLFYIDYLSKIELSFKGEKINHFYINYDDIDDESIMLNKIKERFVELEFTNYRENQKRANEVIQFLEIVKSLLRNVNESQNLANENQIENNLKFSYTLEKAINKIEKTYSKLINFFSPLMNLSLAVIEKDLIKKISLVVQDPILSNEEIEILYKEIQNVTLISNELAHVKVENKKIILDNEIYKNEICQINNTIDQYRKQIKLLEEGMENFNIDMSKKDAEVMEKGSIIENLENEILFLKQNLSNYENCRNLEQEKQLEPNFIYSDNNFSNYENCQNFNEINDENNEIFDLLNSKDKEILHLKSQLSIQEDIINNLKKVLNKKRMISYDNFTHVDN